MRPSVRPDILRVWMTRLEPFNDGVNAVDENLLTSAPNEDTFDDLVDAGKPVCRRE